jgi:hypothetical protein
MLDIVTEEEEQMTIDYINKNNTKCFGSRRWIF